MSAAFALACIAILLLNGVLAVALRRRPAAGTAVYGIALVVSLAMLAGALGRLTSFSAADAVVLPLGLPWIGAHFRIDALSAFFLVVVNLGGAGASLFALGYGRHEHAPERVLPFFSVFLAAMNLVVLADDAFAFLFSWEFMSLTSWALVMAHHEDAENRQAGFVYIVMASAGTLALLLAFGLLAGATGDYAFSAMRAASLAPLAAALVMVLALAGAGSKAGIVPLHVWLPLAHPAAPSHVSALMSGVMTKVAVYAFIRIAFDLVGPLPWWWATIVVVLGGVTAVAGVLYALMQHDLKRLLAYHTVENIGIIFIGLGLALGFRTNGMQAAAALAMTAALFHVFNHSLFKSLLFFGSGAVLNATGTRDMERLGGLIHRMPVTAFAFLAGSAAISALPPLNGFVSEWLTFQAILLSPDLPQWDLKIMVPAAGALLALSAALAAACFVKAYGVSFLGRPRSEEAADAKEVDRFSLAAMLALAAPLPSRRPLPRLRHRCACRRSQRSSPAPACRCSRRCRGCPSCRWRPAAAPITASWSSPSSCSPPASAFLPSTASPRARCAGRRPGIAAFPMPIRQRNTARRASPSRSAGSMGRSSSPPARRSTCRRRATCARPPSTSPSAISSGRRSTSRWPASSARRPTSSTASSS